MWLLFRGSMRYGIASLLVVGCVSSAGVLFADWSEGSFASSWRRGTRRSCAENVERWSVTDDGPGMPRLVLYSRVAFDLSIDRPVG